MMTPTSSSRTCSALLALALCLILSACGFHLRGSDGSYNLPFSTVYMNLPDSSPLAIDLKRQIRGMGTTAIASDSKSADGVIEVMVDPESTRGKSILSINNNGRVREYLLSYTIEFRIRDNHGNELLKPTRIGLTRSITFNETQLLAKETEEALLYRDMRTDMVQQMLRRMAAIKLVVPAMSMAPQPVVSAAPVNP
jgi:LPS-assembly lipoprotein